MPLDACGDFEEYGAARTLHPQRFAQWDLAAEMRRFYTDFFGTRLTDAQMAEILSGEL